MFYTDVAKVDSDVIYVAMVCTSILQASIPNVYSVFQTYVASVFIWMLHMFHTYIAKCFIWMLCMFVVVFKCL